jgi:hypothetical protein
LAFSLKEPPLKSTFVPPEIFPVVWGDIATVNEDLGREKIERASGRDWEQGSP